MPRDITAALQALAYWVGYQDARLPSDLDVSSSRGGRSDGRTMFEGAIGDELCRLLQANLQGCVALSERPYRQMVGEGLPLHPSVASGRADIVIARGTSRENAAGSNIAGNVRCVIEIKRTGASPRAIRDDLIRLAAWHAIRADATARAFLVLVSQGITPPHDFEEKVAYVNRGTGTASRRLFKIEDKSFGTVYYQVRRVLKASASFNPHSRAHFVTLLEVTGYQKI